MSAKLLGTCPFQLRLTSAPAAPDLAAASTKSCASKFSPCSATNNSPGLIVRESVLILLITTVPSPDSSEAPTNCAICESLSGFIAKAPRDDPRSRVARFGCHQTGSCNRRTPDSFRVPCPQPKRCRADAPAQRRG